MTPDSTREASDTPASGAGENPSGTGGLPNIVSAADRRLMRRLTLILGFLFLFVFAFSRLQLLYGDKFYDVTNTGRAQWIWMPVRMVDGDPAAFYATRDLDLPPGRQFTQIKVLGDPEYTLYFNGVEIGGRRVEEDIVLDTYDVSKLARDKGNRIVVAASSPNGVGGLIVSVDLTQEFRNYVVTDRDWHIVPHWWPDILQRDHGPILRPLLLGRPPARRWNYLTRRPGRLLEPPKSVLAPHAAFSFRTSLADIQVLDGVAVTVSVPVAATAYDFGIGASGRLRLTTPAPSAAARVIRVRFTTERSELYDVEGGVTTFTLAPGQRTVVDPEPRVFRFAEVYGSGAKADLLQ